MALTNDQLQSCEAINGQLTLDREETANNVQGASQLARYYCRDRRLILCPDTHAGHKLLPTCSRISYSD
jgi:hypothetical protein